MPFVVLICVIGVIVLLHLHQTRKARKKLAEQRKDKNFIEWRTINGIPDAAKDKNGEIMYKMPPLDQKLLIKSKLPLIDADNDKNKTTGHPMASSLKIALAKQTINQVRLRITSQNNKLEDAGYGVLTKYADDPRVLTLRRYAVIYTLAALPDAKATYQYLQGNWEEAEKLWYSVLYTSFRIGEKLARLYIKDHKYEDAVKAMYAATIDPDTAKGMISRQRLNESKKLYDLAVKKAQENKKEDQSSIPLTKEQLMNKISEQQKIFDSKISTH